MAEARLPAALKAHGAAGTDGGSDRTLVGEVPFRVGTLNGQIGTVEAMSRQEDWLQWWPPIPLSGSKRLPARERRASILWGVL
jgi:hypothetical protein